MTDKVQNLQFQSTSSLTYALERDLQSMDGMTDNVKLLELIYKIQAFFHNDDKKINDFMAKLYEQTRHEANKKNVEAYKEMWGVIGEGSKLFAEIGKVVAESKKFTQLASGCGLSSGLIQICNQFHAQKMGGVHTEYNGEEKLYEKERDQAVQDTTQSAQKIDGDLQGLKRLFDDMISIKAECVVVKHKTRTNRTSTTHRTFRTKKWS
jgi:hypothetical protein